jgi:hypothetical protein
VGIPPHCVFERETPQCRLAGLAGELGCVACRPGAGAEQVIGDLGCLDIAATVCEYRQYRSRSVMQERSLVDGESFVDGVADQIVPEAALAGLSVAEQAGRVGFAHRGAELG